MEPESYATSCERVNRCGQTLWAHGCDNYIKRPSTKLNRKALQNAHPKGWANGRIFMDERGGTRANEDL